MFFFLDSTCPLPLLPPSPFAAVVSLMPPPPSLGTKTSQWFEATKESLAFRDIFAHNKIQPCSFFFPLMPLSTHLCLRVSVETNRCTRVSVACESHERPKVSLSYPVLRIFAQVFDEYFQLFVKGFLCPPTDLFPVSAYNRGAIFGEWDLCSLCNWTVCIQFKLNQMYYAFFPCWTIWASLSM